MGAGGWERVANIRVGPKKKNPKIQPPDVASLWLSPCLMDPLGAWDHPLLVHTAGGRRRVPVFPLEMGIPPQ